MIVASDGGIDFAKVIAMFGIIALSSWLFSCDANAGGRKTTKQAISIFQIFQGPIVKSKVRYHRHKRHVRPLARKSKSTFGVSISGYRRAEEMSACLATKATPDRRTLHHKALNLLQTVERQCGPLTVVSACRPGARIPTGELSWHAVGGAFDVLSRRKGCVVEALRRAGAGTMTYAGMDHVHGDIGPAFFARNAKADDEHAQSFAVAYAPATHPADAKIVREAIPSVINPAKPVPSSKPPVNSQPPKKADVQSCNPTPYSFRHALESAQRGLLATTDFAADVIDDARWFVVKTAIAGTTMLRQGKDVAVGRLHPEFAKRIAATISEARASGLPNAAVFSAYRPPVFGIGGFRDKHLSLHAYGLAVDMAGIGRPGSKESIKFYRIAQRHGLYNPYGPYHRAEWNHYQPTFAMKVVRGMELRSTITKHGPKDLKRMWASGDKIIRPPGIISMPRKVIRIAKRKWHRYARNVKRYAAAGYRVTTR